MPYLRPRFSMRLLLIAFAMLAVLLYLLVVRPTTVANRFIRAIAERDYKLAASMLDGGDFTSFATHYSEATCYAQLIPRSWSDIWNFRRSISVNSYVSMKYRNQRTGNEDFKPIYQQTSVFKSGPFRVRLIQTEGVEIL